MTAAALTVLLALAAPPGPMSTPVPFDGSPLAQTWSCTPRRTCKQITTCDEAVWYLKNCTWGQKLDGDSDGIPCETICGN
jgi:Excalibur calcium-binding domain